MTSPGRVLTPPASPLAGAPSPAWGTARRADTNSDVTDLWQRLGNATAQLMRSPRKLPLAATIVLPNTTGVRCLDNEQVIEVDRGGEDKKKIHAHDLTLLAPDSHTTTRCHSAGQSPPIDTYQDFLLQGIASGKGIFQFVSRKAHYDVGASVETPIISLLEKAWLDPHRTDPFLLGERYQIKSFRQVAGRQAQHLGSPVQDSKNDYLRYQLVVTDTKAEDGAYKTIDIPITQAGLKFTGRVLEADAIGRASQLVDEHLACLHNKGMPADAAEKDPLIVSQAGFGRNATLITYRNLKGRKLKGKQLDDALNDVIMIGRKTRDPRFVHSEAQLSSLRDALNRVDVDPSPDGASPKLRPSGTSAHEAHIRESFEERRETVTSASPPRALDELTYRAEYLKAIDEDPNLLLNDEQYLKFQDLMLGLVQTGDPKPAGTVRDYLVGFANSEGIVGEHVEAAQLDLLNEGVEEAQEIKQHSDLQGPLTPVPEDQGTPPILEVQQTAPRLPPRPTAVAQDNAQPPPVVQQNSPPLPPRLPEVTQVTPAVQQAPPTLPPRPQRSAQEIAQPTLVDLQIAPANSLTAPRGRPHRTIQEALVAIRTLKEELEDTRRRQTDAPNRRLGGRVSPSPRVDTLGPHIETLESMEHHLLSIEKCIPNPADANLEGDRYNIELAYSILPKYFFDVSAIRIRVDADRLRLDHDSATHGLLAMHRRAKASDSRLQLTRALNHIVETCGNTNNKLKSAIRHVAYVHRRLQERGDSDAAIHLSATTGAMTSALQLVKLDNDELLNKAIQRREDLDTLSVHDLERLKIIVDRDENLTNRGLEYANEMRFLAKYSLRETVKIIPNKSDAALRFELAHTQIELVNEVAKNVDDALAQATHHKARLSVFLERTQPAVSPTRNPRTLAADRSRYAIAGMAKSKSIVATCVERLETSIHAVEILENQLAIYKQLVDPTDIKHLSQRPQFHHVTNLEWHCRLQAICRELRDHFQEGLTAAITASLYLYGPATHRGEGFERVPRNRNIMRMTLGQRDAETRGAINNVTEFIREAKRVLQQLAPSREISTLLYFADYLEHESPKAITYFDASIAKLLQMRKEKRSLATAFSMKKFDEIRASEWQYNLNSCNAVEYAWALSDSARYLRGVANTLSRTQIPSQAATLNVEERLPMAAESLDDMAPAAID